MPRAVIDTGVVVSRVLYPLSVPALALKAARKTGVILISDDMREELIDVPARQKFARYANEQKLRTFIQSYIDVAEYVPVVRRIRACADPDDDKVLALAVSGGADFIVSSDRDLLALDPFRGVNIVTPRDFLEITDK